jgi:IS605 OrfB family transposase
MKALRLKVHPESWPWLDQAAREVNFAWNFSNETRHKAAHPFFGKPRYLSGWDLDKLATGAGEVLKRIGTDTICRVNSELVTKCKAVRRSRLRWRVSAGPRRSLGWVPFKSANLRRHGNAIRFRGKTFRVFNAGLLTGAKLRQGSFSQNALGEWFINIAVETASTDVPAEHAVVGIDLGLKSAATTSDGDVLEASQFYRGIEPRIAQAQRRGHKRQAKRLHLKAKNRRADALHKFSTKIVAQYQNIRIGDVSSSKLAKTKMAKSVLDAGWYMLKTQLQYKGQQAGRSVEVVDEAYTTRACSNCGALTGPAGLDMLAVRSWRCSDCGTEHERDVNAARNIAMTPPRCRRPSAGTRARTGVTRIESQAVEHHRRIL